MKKMIIFLVLISFSAVMASQFPCQINISKPACWKKFDVTVNIVDVVTLKTIKTFDLKDDLTKTVKFSCNPNQQISFTASFTPVIWQGDEHKIYQSKHAFQVVSQLAKGDVAWQVGICFPSSFHNVPLPNVSDTSQCVCPKPKKANSD